VRFVLILLAAALLAACGGGGEDRSKAQLRLVNASATYAALDLVVDDARLQSSVAYGQSASYVEIDPEETATEITRPGSSTPLATANPAVSEGDRYTLVAFGGEGSLRTTLLDDNADAPDSGKVRVRVLNAAPDAGNVDVYLTTADAPLADAEALQAAAAVGTVTAYTTVDAATWRLRVTAAGDRDDLRLDLSGISLTSRDVVTLVITPGSGGVLVNALVVVQRGAIGIQAGASARVRAVAAVTDSGAVAATVGGVALMNGTGAPAVGRYLLVPAGAAVATANVNGNAVTVPAATLTAGADYTLLVWGPASGGAAAWLEDDNRPPTVSTRAKLRLVNGVAGLAATLALTLDFIPVADGVAGGSASPTTLVDTTADGTLTVTSPGLGAALWSDTEVVLAAGSVYTLFVVGPSGAPTGILRKDR
jgi:Domain of unknown function (DUF4397)